MPANVTRLAGLVALFRSRPNEWISALDLMPVAGTLSWRTRVSDCRKAPHFLNIQNRTRLVQRGARRVLISEYRLVVEGENESGKVEQVTAATALLQ